MKKRVLLMICVLILLVLALASCSTAKKAEKIKLGMTQDEVLEILGKPDEKENMGYTYLYFDSKMSKKLEKADDILEEAFESEDEKEIEKAIAEYDELMQELEEMDFSSLTVSFNLDGEVEEVFYNAKANVSEDSLTTTKEVKKAVLRVGKVEGDLATIEGETTFEIDSDEGTVGYSVKYKDGSYYLGEMSVYDLDLKKSYGEYYVTWADDLGEYSVQKLFKINEYVVQNGILTYLSAGREEFTVPTGVTAIADNCTVFAPNLKSVSIPASVKAVGVSAFSVAKNLEVVTLDNDIEAINENAFLSCNSIKTVYFNGNRTEFYALNVSGGNDRLKNASIVYNCDPGTHTDGEIKTENFVSVSCTQNASHDMVTYCLDCLKEINRENVITEEAKGHTSKSPIQENRVEPTCAKEGSYEEVIYCRDCEQEVSRETKTLEKLPHTEITVEENRIASTCTVRGSYDAVTNCSVCNNELKREKITLSLHTYENGYCTVCGAEQPYTRVDKDTILFGSYPQTEVTDSTLKATLNSLAGTIPTSSNAYNWTSYGYYISGSTSNYMWYIDIEEGGEKYRGVYFTSYRPYYPTNSSSTSNTYQDDNGYKASNIYWFKYEPISWTILNENNGTALILCDMIIDSQQFDYDGSYSNNYAESTIRKWLNETFLNTAFNELQKEIILTTKVDNSVASTGYSSNPYACENTEDKVFLLSYKELTTYLTTNASRMKKTTDYAQAQGAYTSTSSSYLGNGYWWLRSPGSSNSNYARHVYYGGFNYSFIVYYTDRGVVPALQIQL